DLSAVCARSELGSASGRGGADRPVGGGGGRPGEARTPGAARERTRLPATRTPPRPGRSGEPAAAAACRRQWRGAGSAGGVGVGRQPDRSGGALGVSRRRPCGGCAGGGRRWLARGDRG